MGSFNIHCGLTGKNISSGDAFYGIYLQQTMGGLEESLGKNIFVSRDNARFLFQPISIPYLMTHNGYGRFDLVNPEDPLFLEFKNNQNLTNLELLGDVVQPTIPCAVFSKEAFECAVRLLEKNPDFHFTTKDVEEEFEDMSRCLAYGWSLKRYPFPLLEQHKKRYLNYPQTMYSYFFQTEAVAFALNMVGRFFHAALYCSEDADTALFIKSLAEAVPSDYPDYQEEEEE